MDSKPSIEQLALATRLGLPTEPPKVNSSDLDYFYVETKVVEKAPRQAKKKPKEEEGPPTLLGTLKKALASPAAQRHAMQPKREGKFYHVNEQCQIIETRVTRAGLAQGFNQEGGDIRKMI